MTPAPAPLPPSASRRLGLWLARPFAALAAQLRIELAEERARAVRGLALGKRVVAFLFPLPSPRLVAAWLVTQLPRPRPEDVLRGTLLGLLLAAPLAFGAVHEAAYYPLLVVSFFLGLASWAGGHSRRAQGAHVPFVPGRRLLLAFHGLVLLQLVPLPPELLRVLSPGTFAYLDHFSLVPVTAWHPVSVSPADTVRGLAFLAALSLLYAAAFRDLSDRPWRRRLALTLVLTGFLMTLVALFQAASGQTTIYGLWQPRFDWAVFGPYVNRNHFAGFMVMVVPVAVALAAEAFRLLRQGWSRRPHMRWLALGEIEGSATLRHTVAAAVLMVGLLASQSRGGLLGFVLSAAVLLVVLRRRLLTGLLTTAVVGFGLAWVDLSGVVAGFESRGIKASRLDLWQDAVRLVPDFPILGAGLNAFGTAFSRYQTIWKGTWVGEAHNEYLQVLVDTGVLGVVLAVPFLGLLLRNALRAARRGRPLDAGLLAALLGSAIHNLVEFNWQIPANALAFVVIAGLATRRGLDLSSPAQTASQPGDVDPSEQDA